MVSQKKTDRFVRFFLPPILWASLIFLFSSFPTVSTSDFYWQDFAVKKTAHIVEYGILSVLLFRAMREGGMNDKKAALVAIFAAIFYGVSDEIHQSFTPGREPRARDVVFDTIGAISFTFFIWKLLPKAPLRLRSLAKRLDLL